jgi:hypothetical protein
MRTNAHKRNNAFYSSILEFNFASIPHSILYFLQKGQPNCNLIYIQIQFIRLYVVYSSELWEIHSIIYVQSLLFGKLCTSLSFYGRVVCTVLC